MAAAAEGYGQPALWQCLCLEWVLCQQAAAALLVSKDISCTAVQQPCFHTNSPPLLKASTHKSPLAVHHWGTSTPHPAYL